MLVMLISVHVLQVCKWVQVSSEPTRTTNMYVVFDQFWIWIYFPEYLFRFPCGVWTNHLLSLTWAYFVAYFPHRLWLIPSGRKACPSYANVFTPWNPTKLWNGRNESKSCNGSLISCRTSWLFLPSNPSFLHTTAFCVRCLLFSQRPSPSIRILTCWCVRQVWSVPLNMALC